MEEAGHRGEGSETDANDRRVTSCPSEATPPVPVVMETEQDNDKQADDLWETPQRPGPGPGPGPGVDQGPGPGPVVVRGKNPAGEKLERVRKWSISTYKVTRQALAERLGRGSRTVDLDLEPRLELLRDDRRRYDDVTRLAQTLANQLARFSLTQKSLGQAFSELSVKTPALHVEFGVNAEAQKFLSRSGETLVAAINAFTADMTTLVTMTMGDTVTNAQQYEAARMEYDAYRVDLEDLNLGPRDPVSLAKLDQAQKEFQVQRERYQRIREDLTVKVRLLHDNKVKVLHHQLWLLHGAVAAHSLSCHSFLDQNLHRVSDQVHNPGLDSRSWLEES